MVKKYIEERYDWPDKIPVVNGRMLNSMVTDISPINTHIELLSSRINWLRNRLFYSTVQSTDSITSLPYPSVDIGVVEKNGNTALIFSGRYLGNGNSPIPYMLLFNKDTEVLEQTDIPAYPYYANRYIKLGTKIYCFGGYDYDPNNNRDIPTNSVMCFDMSTGTWETLPDLPFPIAHHVVEYIGDNSVLLTTGITITYTGSKVYSDKSIIYNIVTGDSYNIKSYPYQLSMADSLLLDGKVTVFGGETPNSIINRIYQYNNHNNDWELFTPNLPLPRSGFSIIQVGDLIIRIYGKSTNLHSTTLEVMDTNRKPLRWRNINVYGFSRLSRQQFGTCTLGNDSIVLFGGYVGSSTPTNKITILNY